jgi:hypothetical protein
MKHLLALVFLLFVLVPVMAQDATEAATVEANPVTVIDGTGEGDTVTCEAGATCNVNETEDPPATENEVQDNTVSVLIGVVMLAVLFFGGFALYFVSQLVPGGVAKELFDAGVKAGYQMALSRAESTKTTLDDQVYSALANVQGLDVTKDADGHYVVKLRAPVSVSSTGGSFDSSQSRMP